MSDSDPSPMQRRRSALVDILREHEIHSQVDLLSHDGQGMPVDQATLSRDLRSLGVSKGPSGYQPPDSPEVDRSVRRRLASLLRDHLLGMDPSGSMLVLKVTPGYASAIAVEIDQAGLPGFLGSIAGRDTVFLAADGDVGLRRLRSDLTKLTSRVPRIGPRELLCEYRFLVVKCGWFINHRRIRRFRLR